MPGSGSISHRHDSADADSPKCHGSGKLTITILNYTKLISNGFSSMMTTRWTMRFYSQLSRLRYTYSRIMLSVQCLVVYPDPAPRIQFLLYVSRSKYARGLNEFVCKSIDLFALITK